LIAQTEPIFNNAIPVILASETLCRAVYKFPRRMARHHGAV
jgi:hypothetical protein